MKRYIFSFVLLFWAVFAAFAAGALRFNADGTFKIVQFTDTHFKYGNPMSDVVRPCIAEVLDVEKPQLVVFTGDLIYASPGREGLNEVLAEVVNRNIPFVVTLGNHDDEQDMTRPEIYDYVRTFPGCLQPADPDFALEIAGKDTDNAATVYCIDSHAYTPIQGVGKYAWHTLDQINWYVAQSKARTAANGGTPVPSIAFFHIPVQEFVYASSTDGNPLIGTRREKPGCPALNSGMFTAMKEGGDIMGIFVGHEHNNDYSTIWHGILLAYGRYSGGNTVYNHLSNGARVILLREGTRTFDTWLRLRGGARIDATRFPDSYVTDPWRERTQPLAPTDY